MSPPPAVVAFGGNALLPDPFQPQEQEARARELARVVAHLSRRSPGLVLVHGNGPQVGMILLRVEATRERLPAEPLDVLVAETQGSVGCLLGRALHNALLAERAQAPVTSILTQAVVDPRDAAFEAPAKPVGPFYAEGVARRLMDERGWHMTLERGRGWRRVVPSPRPLDVVEIDAIRAAAHERRVVVAGGGGGIPVVRDAKGALSGIEAVIDKDRTASLIARAIGARAFLVLTGVPHVSRAFGTEREERLAEIGVAQGRELLAAGEFPAGSMRPKVEAACDYVSASGRPALITDMAHLVPALAGEAGTRIVP